MIESSITAKTESPAALVIFIYTITTNPGSPLLYLNPASFGEILSVSVAQCEPGQALGSTRACMNAAIFKNQFRANRPEKVG